MINVKSVTIYLSGRVNLKNLESLGYKPLRHAWIFTGKMHTYEFKEEYPGMTKVTILGRKDGKETTKLIPEITFSQVKDWIGKSVEVISVSKSS